MSEMFGGMPVIRHGDNVFLIGSMPSSFDDMKKTADRMLERMLLAAAEYRCPFSILSEFDQWFEWYRRLHHKRQTTGTIITAMLTDKKRIEEHKIEPKLRFAMDLRVSAVDKRLSIILESA